MKKLFTILSILACIYCKGQNISPYDSAWASPLYGWDKLDTIHQNALLRNLFALHLYQVRHQSTNDSTYNYVTKIANKAARTAKGIAALKAAGYIGNGSLSDFTFLWSNYPNNGWPQPGSWYYYNDPDSLDRIQNEINFYSQQSGITF